MGNNPSSEELAQRAQQGCRASFTELAERFTPRLQVFLYRRTGCCHEAADLVQETLFKAYRNLHRYRPRWRFSTWLFTIASREAVSRQRRNHRDDFPATNPVAAPHEVVESREEGEKLWALAAELPDGQYRALWLRYSEDLSIKEIARAMGKSQVCVKVLLYRARVFLAKRWRRKPGNTSG